MYNVNLKPKWFSVFYMVSHNDKKSITEIANETGHSHPSVSKIVSEMD
ncbi:helix-turn-helix domain-containing protein [Aquimarina longa]